MPYLNFFYDWNALFFSFPYRSTLSLIFRRSVQSEGQDRSRLVKVNQSAVLNQLTLTLRWHAPLPSGRWQRYRMLSWVMLHRRVTTQTVRIYTVHIPVSHTNFQQQLYRRSHIRLHGKDLTLHPLLKPHTKRQLPSHYQHYHCLRKSRVRRPLAHHHHHRHRHLLGHARQTPLPRTYQQE